MPVFTRRRLQCMLDELRDHAKLDKLKDFRGRLESKRAYQALPAEIELAFLWALSKLGNIEVEPEWFGTARPEAYSESLFAPHPCLVEVTALSDARLAQEHEMRHIAAQLSEFASSVRKGQGIHLRFTFQEESGYGHKGYFRRRRIHPDFSPNGATKAALRSWLLQASRKTPLEIMQDSTHILVTWHDSPQHPLRNFFCSMPAEAFSLEDNPLFEALIEKRKQLRSPTFEGLRCIVVGDAGAHILQDLNPRMRSMEAVTGSQVIEHFLENADGAVDVVIVLSPKRKSHPEIAPRTRLLWQAELFVRHGISLPTSGLDLLVATLPAPRFEGYQARYLQQQAAFRPDADGWYVGTTITEGATTMTIKVSARAVLELLAGRLTTERFQHFTGLEDKPNQKNILAHRLSQGDILSAIEIEHGVDEDDDWLVMHLRRDPAAAPLSVAAPDTARDTE